VLFIFPPKKKMAAAPEVQVSGVLRDVWELQYVQFGDQGGCVGSWARFFVTKEAAHTWFSQFQMENPRDEYEIYKEFPRKAIVMETTNGTEPDLYLLDKDRSHRMHVTM
jgi:hypothetical protein